MSESTVKEYVMSFGDHLEDLRRRMIHALIGVVVICVITFCYGDLIVAWIQHPLHHAQRQAGLPAKTFGFGVTTGFAVYMQVSLISGLILSGPWLLYQIWRFVEAGLYKSEKKLVLILAPFSAIMTGLGVCFAYYIMLPVCLAFLITFTISYPSAGGEGPSIMDRVTHIVEAFAKPAGSSTQELIETPIKPQAPSSSIGLQIPLFTQDPVQPANGEIWFNSNTSELKLQIGTQVKSIPLATDSLMSPLIEIRQYINFVTYLTLGVVVAFQLPLIMLIIGWSGFLPPQVISQYRKHCIFICFFLGAVLTPADPVSMVILAIPLWILFEFGLKLMKLVYKPRFSDDDEDDTAQAAE
ncbi:MAG: twin-arginine translocase subunit TatC [Phycisphaeraceae bacterium]|nr:twin-arginine translocase subunit TatC [Phycisphaeraceae bacterium]